MENWQSHLHAAAGLIPRLLQDKTKHRSSFSLMSAQNSGHKDDADINYFDHEYAGHVLLGTFISLDVMSCVSVHSSPVLMLDHISTLDVLGIDLENLSGCANWMISHIFEIAQLERWKAQANKTNTLNVIELAKRGCYIEQRLQQRIFSLESSIASRRSSKSSSKMSSVLYKNEITYIFALSAMTYVHVIISGAHPGLPDIVEMVSKTVAAFQGLSDAKLLRHLVWPFCVSGCLAREGQQSSFRYLIAEAEISQSTAGTCFEAYKIMQQCWEARKLSPDSCDWISIMNRRGRYVLLW